MSFLRFGSEAVARAKNRTNELESGARARSIILLLQIQWHNRLGTTGPAT